MISALWARFVGWAGGILIVLGAIGAIWAKGRRDGIAKMEAEQRAAREAAARAKKEADDEVARLGSNDLDERFRQWVRRP